MSRIGKRPVEIPDKVNLTLDGQQVSVKGPKGELSRVLPDRVIIEHENNTVTVRPRDDSPQAKRLHGLCRTLIANMVEGVSKGFEIRLEIQGVGYRAQLQGNTLTLNLGFSKPVQMAAPEGIEFAVENNTNIFIRGINKEKVGDTAAKIRDLRPPEPYKGKGIRYQGEQVRRKAGKAGKK
ncbi:50S ribosomal protein L6 [Geitlerinema sp. PCC 9228]|jgi:large subunit ribosomal protein L6|uniref:50S ribosomal protein L6 n=1 Tax=Geitlerinema sp. PCC 9228 TaxID=111611 RepID=UPI0008F999C4|nr:50S ribosomal protein L6 [Geitlerinema sp. PCC 9228]